MTSQTRPRKGQWQPKVTESLASTLVLSVSSELFLKEAQKRIEGQRQCGTLREGSGLPLSSPAASLSWFKVLKTVSGT